jgi:hypothetical protein
VRLRGRQRGRVVERHILSILAIPHHVDRYVDSGPAKVAFLIVKGLGRIPTADQADKDLLQNVFRVGGVAGDPVGRTEDETVSLLEDPLDRIGGRGRCSFSNRDFQGAPPARSL